MKIMENFWQQNTLKASRSLNLITDEKMKLEFVQYAYGFTIDKNNYQRLEKLFTGADQIATFKKFYQSRTQE